MKSIWLTIFVLLLGSNAAFSVGLGDTVSDFEKSWNKGYRRVFPSTNTVHVGIGESCYIGYVTGDWGYSFGKPPRIGLIEGSAKGLFGAANNQNPTSEQFFNGMKSLLPSDFQLINAYEEKKEWTRQIFTFKSNTINHLPDVKASMAYAKDGFNNPVGTFFLIVNGDISDKKRISSFTLALGLPGSVDLISMKKKQINPFK
jgi:hypothetical protein